LSRLEEEERKKKENSEIEQKIKSSEEQFSAAEIKQPQATAQVPKPVETA
jgi:hypothetical protein